MNENIRQNMSQVHPEIRKFPIEGTNLARVLHDPQHRKAFHARLKQYNPLIVALYRIGLLPLFGASRTVMLLTTRGNKSGKLRSTPIGFFRIRGLIYLFSAWGKGTGWYKNMVANPGDIWIQIGMRKFSACAEALENPTEIQEILDHFVTESPAQAHYLFGWEPGRDQMSYTDFTEVINRVLIVRFIEKSR
jgi:deazaflavin-dependent oxidoreductase (nitroreductase family)